MHRFIAPLCTAVLFAASSAQAAKFVPNAVEKQALSNDTAIADAAIAALRDQGPDALDRLFMWRDQWSKSPKEVQEIGRLNQVIDRVGGQRYCSTSRLYWYTDLEKAKKEAQQKNLPILSLRMMGNLTDEFSCANSRFFRTTLYANKSIAETLRTQFVLHWKSVRPVPKVTIDYGNGRKLHRTLTGNSIHYVLDRDGRVIDGLPGLYGPKQFAGWLRDITDVCHYVHGRVKLPEKYDRQWLINRYHLSRINRIARAWQADARRVTAKRKVAAAAQQGDGGAPPAERAAMIARPKALVEMPLIQVVNQIRQLKTETDADMWDEMAALHLDDAQLDESSISLIRAQRPHAGRANRLTETKRRVEDPLLRLISNLQTSIAVDTVRNEYQLHRQIHEWFLADTPPTDVDALNERVYAELFLTPSSDPWIGLMPQNTYTGLDRNGVELASGR